MKRLHSFSAFLFLLGACTGQMQDSMTVQEPSSPEKKAPLFVTVEFTDELAESIEREGTKVLASGLDEMGIISLERVFPDAGEWEERHREAGLHRFYRVVCSGEQTATKAVKSMSELPYILNAEIEPPVEMDAIPFNDPFANVQWSLYNDGSISSIFSRGVDINVVPVWEYSTGRSDVIVSVVDSGVDYRHQDLDGVVLEPGPEGSRCFVTGHTGYTLSAERHGTHVAGIIAAKNNNGAGICGIAGGSDGKGGVRIMSCQYNMTDPNNSSSTLYGDTSAAVVWGADHGAVISQNSWSYSYDSEEACRKATIPLTCKVAIDYFIKYAGTDKRGNQIGPMKGGVYISSAGNKNWNCSQPASYEPVIAVGAIGPNGRKTAYSSYGDWCDICAPGGSSPYYDSKKRDLIYSTVSSSLGSSGYDYMAGTSQACPMVSGVAALIVSAMGGPGFTNEDLVEALTKGANRSYGVNERIGPLVDAYSSLLYLMDLPEPVVTSDYEGDYRIKAHEILSVSYKVENLGATPQLTVTCDESASYDIDGASVSVVFNSGRGDMTGKHTLVISSRPSSSHPWSKYVVEYEILPNHAPEQNALISDQFIGKQGSQLTLPLNGLFVDPDGEKLSFSASRCSVFTASIQESVLTLTAEKDGVDVLTLTASDKIGQKASMNFRVGVMDDSLSPVISPEGPVKDQITVTCGKAREMAVSLRDEAGTVKYSATVKVDIFNPVTIDLSDCAPGRYFLSVLCDGKLFEKQLTKE